MSVPLVSLQLSAVRQTRSNSDAAAVGISKVLKKLFKLVFVYAFVAYSFTDLLAPVFTVMQIFICPIAIA